MTRISETVTETITLEGNPGDVLDLEVTFDIEGETYPAEPYSYGWSRGTELEIGAEFVSARWGGLTINRDMALAICGATYLARIEESVKDAFVQNNPEIAA